MSTAIDAAQGPDEYFDEVSPGKACSTVTIEQREHYHFLNITAATYEFLVEGKPLSLLENAWKNYEHFCNGGRVAKKSGSVAPVTNKMLERLAKEERLKDSVIGALSDIDFAVQNGKEAGSIRRSCDQLVKRYVELKRFQAKLAQKSPR